MIPCTKEIAPLVVTVSGMLGVLSMVAAISYDTFSSIKDKVLSLLTWR
jgi:hypothetical protein